MSGLRWLRQYKAALPIKAMHPAEASLVPPELPPDFGDLVNGSDRALAVPNCGREHHGSFGDFPR